MLLVHEKKKSHRATLKAATHAASAGALWDIKAPCHVSTVYKNLWHQPELVSAATEVAAQQLASKSNHPKIWWLLSFHSADLFCLHPCLWPSLWVKGETWFYPFFIASCFTISHNKEIRCPLATAITPPRQALRRVDGPLNVLWRQREQHSQSVKSAAGIMVLSLRVIKSREWPPDIIAGWVASLEHLRLLEAEHIQRGLERFFMGSTTTAAVTIRAKVHNGSTSAGMKWRQTVSGWEECLTLNGTFSSWVKSSGQEYFVRSRSLLSSAVNAKRTLFWIFWLQSTVTCFGWEEEPFAHPKHYLLILFRFTELWVSLLWSNMCPECVKTHLTQYITKWNVTTVSSSSEVLEPSKGAQLTVICLTNRLKMLTSF